MNIFWYLFYITILLWGDLPNHRFENPYVQLASTEDCNATGFGSLPRQDLRMLTAQKLAWTHIHQYCISTSDRSPKIPNDDGVARARPRHASVGDTHLLDSAVQNFKDSIYQTFGDLPGSNRTSGSENWRRVHPIQLPVLLLL